MYQNVYYQREKNLLHLWDDKFGHRSFPYTRYAYQKAQNGEYVSLYGDRLTKVYKFKRDDPELFESDVAETTRALVDTYTDSDEMSTGHVILTFDIEVEMETGLPNNELAQNEITAIGLHDSATDQYYVLVMDKDRKMTERKTKRATVLPFVDERDLLSKYLDLYEEISPTIVTGWNADEFDTPYLYNRIKNVLGARHANRLSPIGECFWSPYRKRWFMAGVSYLDYLTLYKKYTYVELDNYRLDTVGLKELGKGKIEHGGSLDVLFNTDIDKFIEYNLVDVEIVVELERKLQFIDIARGICHAGHVPYEDFIYSSKYLEGAILTYLKRRGIVSPNKPADREERMQAIKDSKEDTFIGAYVKPPLVGKYEWIYDLDLTSLYPSIIMSLNISPETKFAKITNTEWDNKLLLSNDNDDMLLELKMALDGSTVKMRLDKLKEFLKNEPYTLSANGVLYRKDKVGCIPDILDIWFKQRVEYRSLEKKYGDAGEEEKYKFYKQRQLIQKILLNSLYGVLGLSVWRYYDVDNAEATTVTGRTVIQSTADMANIKYNKELSTNNKDFNIYIDTDSIYFSAVPLLDNRFEGWKDLDQLTISKHVNDIADEMQKYLNNFYDILAKKLFNIDNHKFEIKKEYVSKSGIWLAKKRYAQWIILDNGVPVDRLDVKGLDVVRSSYPMAFRKFMSEVLIDILKGNTEEELTNKIYDFKKSLSTMPVKDIAKSSSIKDLNKYLPKGKQTAMFRFELSTPAHVKAAIAYNQLLTHFGVQNKYAPMKNGDKLKWVYLKQNPFGLDGVAFNAYDDPKQITELIDTYTDFDKIFERELLTKLQDFYDVLGWGAVMASTKVAEKFFSF